MIKTILLALLAICIGIFAGWLAKKIYEVNEKASEEAKKKLEDEFWGRR